MSDAEKQGRPVLSRVGHIIDRSRSNQVLTRLRALLRSNEFYLIPLSLVIGVVAGANAPARDGFGPLRPDHAELDEGAPGAGRHINRVRQSEHAIGDLGAERLLRLRPDHQLAAEPGVERQGVVVDTVAPQLGRGAFRRLGCRRRLEPAEQQRDGKPGPAQHGQPISIA